MSVANNIFTSDIMQRVFLTRLSIKLTTASIEGGPIGGAHRARKLVEMVLGAFSIIVCGAVPAQASPIEKNTSSLGADRLDPGVGTENSQQRNRPNILLVLLDDVGFGDASTFGGPVNTPALDRLAMQGLRYNNFHTAGMCSPTRAALLSGRNHHRIGFGFLAESTSAHIGYDAVWRKSAASIAKVLRMNGYSTAAFGKWHNTPSKEISPVGPFERWPTNLGFEYFYGFMGWATSQWEPELYRNTTAAPFSATHERSYHLTEDLTNDAIKWLRMQAALARDKPYFLYFSTGAVHGPHHVSSEWIKKYRRKFDQGWDQVRKETFARQKKLGIVPAETRLTERPREIPAWESLSANQRELLARQMEIYAGFLEHTDREVGRLIDAAMEGRQGENTLIFYIVGDNGAAGEGGLNGQMDRNPGGWSEVEEQFRRVDELGGAEHDNLYSGAWAWAGVTPFKGLKKVASHFGGTRNPLVVSWPAGIEEKGGVRNQFTYVTDISATIYDIAQVRVPEEVEGVSQLTLDGISFANTLNEAGAPSRRNTQYFEIAGDRAIYHDGWVAAARHSTVWGSGRHGSERDQWELYHVATDFSEFDDVAYQYPEKLAQLQALFHEEARRNNIFPLYGFGYDTVNLTDSQDIVLYPGMPRIPTRIVSKTYASSIKITTELVIPSTKTDGVILSYGNRWEGFALHAKDGHLIFESHTSNRFRDSLVSIDSMPIGRVDIAVEFILERVDTESGASFGVGRLHVNGSVVAEGRLRIKTSLYNGSLEVGQVSNSPVGLGLTPPARFTGEMQRVVLRIQ